jgi:hypothetical protein
MPAFETTNSAPTRTMSDTPRLIRKPPKIVGFVENFLAAALVDPAPAFAQAPKNAVAPPALQREFDGFIAKFRTALKAGDSAAVAGMTRLPFPNDASIRDAADFREKIYKHDFTAKNRACFQRGRAVYDRGGQNYENFFIFCGEQIFVFTNTLAGLLFTEVRVND